MTSGRMLVVAAVAAGALVLGLCVGIFVSGPLAESSSARTLGSPQTPDETTPSNVASDRQHTETSPSEDQAEIVGRFWSTLTIPDDSERHVAWHAMLSKMTPANAMEVRNLFKKMDAQGRWLIPEWDAFWQRWGEVDGAAALEHVKTIGMKGYQPMLAEKILRGWARNDAEGARRWLEANETSPWFQGALRGYLDGFARTNLDAATQDALNLGQGRDFSTLMEVLAEHALRQRQLGGMVDWWRSLPDDSTSGSARQHAVAHVYWRLQVAGLARAGEWLAQLAATPYRPEKQLGELAEKLAAANPAEALKWVESMPPSPSNGRYTGITRTVHALAQQDRTAVETWLKQIPPSPLRDQGAVAYAKFLDSQQQTALAEQWRSQVKDQRFLETDQEKAVQRLTRDLLQSAPPQPRK